MAVTTINKSVLGNGIRILTKKMPYMRSVSMGIWVDAGARDESADESGLSHFIEHMLFKGTHKRNAFQIAKEFDAIGGQTNAFTSMEKTCFHARVADEHLATMFDVLSDILLNSRFETQEIENERPVILQEISMQQDSPDEYVHYLCTKNFWGDTPLGRSILGKRENVSTYDNHAIRNFFQRAYQPERIIISAAGNLDHTRFTDMIEPLFNRFARFDSDEGTRPPLTWPERRTPPDHRTVNLHFRKLEQAHIIIATPGIAITDSRRYAFSLMNTLLGGNMSSRLFQEVRERRGLAYAVYSFLASYADTGMFAVYAGVAPDNVNETIRLIIAEMRNLKNKRISNDELVRAKEFTKGNLVLASESNDNQMVRLAQNEFNLKRQTPLKEVVAKIEAVTTEDIIELARSLFQLSQPSLTVLGPVTESDLGQI
ncbi:pitrilysin family protein [Desulfococcaceae bacterium HSG7]|nr:pitrilysin family protein [Desulfococcaceae bacterium HSG9]MDM8554967.1 pitrilysin family protein [Desulfococcaceae bacterium HSG7]